MFKVLLISDESIITNQIMKNLFEKKCHITHTNDGLEAFIHLVKDKYDLIISSIQLDHLDGFQLMAALRASNGINVLTSFIMITSVESFNEFARLESRPDFILKKDENLLSSLNKIIDASLGVKQRVYNILFIEDDSFARSIIKAWFSKMNEVKFEIIESIAQLKDFDYSQFDLVVSDNLLEDGDLNSVLEIIKDKPVVAYTSTFSSISVDTSTIENLVGIKEKPYDTNYISKMAIKYSAKA